MNAFKPLPFARRGAPVLLLAATLLSGCSLVDAKKDDYKRANRLPSLEIPPTLSTPQADDRYTIPDPKDVAASATYSEYAKSRGLPTLQGGYVPGVGVDPQSAQAHIERAGAERWLVVNGSTDQVWNTVRTFLTENGYEIGAENATLGVLETQWITSKPQVEDDGVLRNLINSLFVNDNANGIRDRYRFRVDHGRKDGTTEVFVTHKGLEEVVVGNSERTVWQARASEPDKEAEMLKRLLVKFGLDQPAARQQVAAAVVAPRAPSATADEVQSGSAAPASASGTAAAVLETGAGGIPDLRVAEPFDRAWRRVGLAIDQAGLQVQDQDRDEGLYFVQYSAAKVKTPASAGAAPAAQGLLGFLGGVGSAMWHKITDSDAATPGKPAATVTVPDGVYRLAVSKTDAAAARVTVLDKAGGAVDPAVARALLGVVSASLR